MGVEPELELELERAPELNLPFLTRNLDLASTFYLFCVPTLSISMIGVHGGRRERADVHREVGTALRLPVRLPADVPVVLLPSRVGAPRRRVCGEICIRRRV